MTALHKTVCSPARPSWWRVSRRSLRGLMALGPSMALAAVALASAAGVWVQGAWLQGADLEPHMSANGGSPVVVAARDASATASWGSDSAQAVAARCERAMLLGRCAVMAATPAATAAPSAADARGRVFIAGTGEVDPGVYEELRRQGDAMCGELRQVCAQDWSGTACRIARALYPPGG